MDSISVLNRTTKDGYTHTYELFTRECIDHDHDFRCRWSDMRVIGEWAMVVRRFYERDGKYAYRLNYRRAKVQDWAITAMSNIYEKPIGFEDQTAETNDPATGIASGPNPEELIEAQEPGENDWDDVSELIGEDDMEESDEASRVLEEANIRSQSINIPPCCCFS